MTKSEFEEKVLITFERLASPNYQYFTCIVIQVVFSLRVERTYNKLFEKSPDGSCAWLGSTNSYKTHRNLVDMGLTTIGEYAALKELFLINFFEVVRQRKLYREW